jgi:hypothetical protein
LSKWKKEPSHGISGVSLATRHSPLATASDVANRSDSKQGG